MRSVRRADDAQSGGAVVAEGIGKASTRRAAAEITGREKARVAELGWTRAPV
jgi:hypothetical protein